MLVISAHLQSLEYCPMRIPPVSLGNDIAHSFSIYNNQDSLVASLDDDKARLWLQDSRFGNERADLVGLKYLFTIQTHSLRLKVLCHFPRNLLFQRYTLKEL